MTTLAVAASTALLKPIIEKLSGTLWKELGMFWGLKKNCEKMKKMLTTINKVLTDAEKKSITDELILHWLLQLQDVAYDIDDFLDDLQIVVQRRNKNNSPVRALHDFCSTDNQVKFRTNMVVRLKKITKRLSEIMEEKNNFELVEGDVLMEEDRTERETISSVNESEVYGRIEEKEKLVNLLIHDKKDEMLSIIPMVGMGGVGKTTLAQIIYNDPEINKRFDPIVWVSVPMNFELSKILSKLIECISGKNSGVSNEEAMQKKLRTMIAGSKFLLVLDDVWNEDTTKWKKLKTILTCGGAGSKILVTTRSGRVATIMGTCDPFKVNPLKFEDCWKLFKQRAFQHISEDENPVLVDIGKEIVRKCKGLPLAAEHLGNLVGLRKLDWSIIRDNEIWQIEECGSGIVPSLLVSYSYLPSHLKQCFAYCSLFPKGFQFKKEYLTHLWTCEGFIPKNKPKADFCFDDLLSQSFFEVSKRAKWDICQYYTMHDLIHDLACHVAGDQFFLRSECENSQNTVSWRYSSIWLNDTVKIKKLRSLICHRDMDLGRKLDSIVLLHCLHVLDLADCAIEVLPDDIGDLKHLRYLKVSSYYLHVLPNALTALINLQVLDLSWCFKLYELPIDLGALENLEVLNLYQCSALKVLPTSLCSLTNLRTLDLSKCDKLALVPKGIGKLTKLERFPQLIIGGEEGCTIGELRQLDLLENDLQIVVEEAWGLQDISTAKLGAKQYLKSLIFKINQKSSDIASLEIPPQLENLCIKWGWFGDYRNFGFDPPSALRTTDFPFKYRNLVSVALYKINECDYFPQFGKLPKLKILRLSLQFPITKLKEHFSGKYGMYPVLEELHLSQYSWEPAEKVEETEEMQEMFPSQKCNT